VTWCGKQFQTRAVATGKVRSPYVDSRVRRTTRDACKAGGVVVSDWSQPCTAANRVASRRTHRHRNSDEMRSAVEIRSNEMRRMIGTLLSVCRWRRGVIGAVEFEADDEYWSMNVKKGVIGLLQVTVGRRRLDESSSRRFSRYGGRRRSAPSFRNSFLRRSLADADVDSAYRVVEVGIDSYPSVCNCLFGAAVGLYARFWTISISGSVAYQYSVVLLWCPGAGHRLADYAALLSIVPEPGTDCRQPSDCQNCRCLHSSTSFTLYLFMALNSL